MVENQGAFDKRIIIGGLPRSGSTLLRFILDASGEIICGPETAFFLAPLHQHQKRVQKVSYRLSKKLDINADNIAEVIVSSNSALEAFDGIMRLFSQYVGVNKSSWAEKTPRNCLNYHRLNAEIKDAYFVSTIRHGLDVVTSIAEDHKIKANEYWCSVQRYIDSMVSIYSFNHPRHIIIKYEELVKEPETVVEDLFTFLKVPFALEVIKNFNIRSRSRDFSKVNQPKLKKIIQPTWIDRYKNPEHIQRVEEFTQRPDALYWLKKSGYSI